MITTKIFNSILLIIFLAATMAAQLSPVLGQRNSFTAATATATPLASSPTSATTTRAAAAAGGSGKSVDFTAAETWILKDARAEIKQRTEFYSNLWTAEMKPEFFENSYKALPKNIRNSVSKNKKLVARFEQLVKKAAEAAGWQAEIRAVLFESETIEAFNYDGLFIVASTGLLTELSDDEIQPVLLHELAHNLFPEERGKLSFQNEYKCDVVALFNYLKLNQDAAARVAETWRKIAAHPLTKKNFTDYPAWESRIDLLAFAGEQFKSSGNE